MNEKSCSRFEAFAQDFVRKYWEVVRDGTFPMPPNEPVEETLEELLAEISHETELEPSSGQAEPLCKLRMTNTCGDWWLFSFRDDGAVWTLVGCSARSDDKKRPDDLLGPLYAPWFEPFLVHVTEIANAERGI